MLVSSLPAPKAVLRVSRDNGTNALTAQPILDQQAPLDMDIEEKIVKAPVDISATESIVEPPPEDVPMAVQDAAILGWGRYYGWNAANGANASTVAQPCYSFFAKRLGYLLFDPK